MQKTKIFISYSHKDEAWKETIVAALLRYIKSKNILIWEDRQIKAGAYWEEEINKAIDQANIAILLVSPDFLESSFILEKEETRTAFFAFIQRVIGQEGFFWGDK